MLQSLSLERIQRLLPLLVPACCLIFTCPPGFLACLAFALGLTVHRKQRRQNAMPREQFLLLPRSNLGLMVYRKWRRQVAMFRQEFLPLKPGNLCHKRDNGWMI